MANVLLALLVLLALPAAVPAQQGVDQIRLEGWIGTAPKDWSPIGELQLRVLERDVRFQVNKARTLSGGAFGPDLVDQMVAQPGLNLYGPDVLLKRFADAKAGTYLALTVYRRQGTRLLEATAVSEEPAPKTP